MYKLKISDLSVGDWVMVEGEDWKVSAISSDSVGLCVDNDYAVAEINECDGILITPEILEKNGFIVGKKIFVYPSTREYVWGDVYLLLVQCGEFYHCRIKKADGWFLTVYAMCYVHELQHAIRLARIEKEIEL